MDFDSDEDLFFEPPKLSQYSMALLNEGLGELEEPTSRHDQDIPMVEAQPRRLIGPSRVHNPLGMPRRVSSRVSQEHAREETEGSESVNSRENGRTGTNDTSFPDEKREVLLYEQLRRERLIQEDLERERERKEAEKLELERERREQERREQERREQERRELERKEKERREREHREIERREIERREIERREKERREIDRRHFEDKDSEAEGAYRAPIKTYLKEARRRPILNKENIPEKVPLKPEHHPVREILFKNQQYHILELLGKGGTSKVHKVRASTGKVYALKQVALEEFDEASMREFRGEIELLEKLRSNKRVVKLIDHSVENGSLNLMMECGDVDLAHVLQARTKLPLDLDLVRFYTREMLLCVAEVHANDIVHLDLKPANFLFVKGMLKLIDFGISNAVPDHTVNVYRDSQIGTPNYMAPEALIESSLVGNGTWKVGKPSDVWSCGCIVYQMVYGRPPYGHYSGHQRLLAIVNPKVQIQYPERGLGGGKVPRSVIEMMRLCLEREPQKRATVKELLEGGFLRPRIVTEQFLRDLIGSAINYGAQNGGGSESDVQELARDVWERISSLNY